MNYGRKNTSKRHSNLHSKSARKKSRSGLRVFKGFMIFCLSVGIIGIITAGILFKKIIDEAPQITADDLKPSAFTTTVYANDGTTVLGTFVGKGSNRVFASLENIPQDLQDAFIAVEDSRFRDHDGVDLKGIARAAVAGITSGNFSQGGSTITQQLIKNTQFPEFSRETTWQSIERKIQEIYLAIQVEKIVDKDTILEDYLNTINLGQNTLGVQAAANRYFGKDVSELTLSECATIAGITKSPSGYNPITNPEANAKRREKVLGDMLEQGYISQEEHDTALADNVYERIQTVNAAYKENSTVHSYFLDEVAKTVIKDLQDISGYTEAQAKKAMYSGGLKIITTQDLTMQKICDEELNNPKNYPSKVEWTVSGAITIQHVDGTENHYDDGTFGKYVEKKYGKNKYGNFGTTFPSQDKANALLEEYIATLKTNENDRVITNITLSAQPQATIVVMDQYTGYVKAMVGGRGEKTANMTLNRATQSPRQPGSTFKILSTYIPALDEKGDTLATVIKDEPFNYTVGEKQAVTNWWGGYKGNLSIRKCIEQSANVCTVKKYYEMTKNTPEWGMNYLKENFGFTTLHPVNDGGQAISLGGLYEGVYNIELTAAYAAIANQGTYTEPILYTQIYDNKGVLILENTPKTHTAMKATTAALITSAMEDVVKYGTGKETKLSNMPVAGKTGTTTDTRDLWFAGYTPYLTASVWSGYDDNQEIEGSSSYHKIIWKKVMQRIHDTYKYENVKFEMPEEGIVRRSICKATGLLVNGDACQKYTEYFVEGTTPKKKCTQHTETTTPETTPDTNTNTNTGTNTGTTTPGGNTTTQ